MAAKVKVIPEGYHSITPYLVMDRAGEAIAFYEKAFGAKELYRISMPDQKVGHAEIQIGDSRVMLSDEFPDMDAKGPHSLGGSPVSLMIYLDNVDEVFARAVELGARIAKPVAHQFYGDRSGALIDPFGHKWTIATHLEDLTPEEMKRRTDDFMTKLPG